MNYDKYALSGVPPKDSSILINALLLHHYKRGAYYPKGGASEITFHIIRTIEKYGGKCLVRAPISQILVNEQGSAHGKSRLHLFSSGGDASYLTGLFPLDRRESEERYGGSGDSCPRDRFSLWHLHHLPDSPSP